ncbi:MAG TPA: aromatic ring-hydroxylating dioxygenase subunit alpha [Terriglobia bacterium]|nr:aromatic ring-hydroxylating dioxygenase subunit alpha [Terriglobia bacterium]
MKQSLQTILETYNAASPLAEASTIPGPWYTDPRVAELERQAVFGRTWQAVGRLDQVAGPGRYFTAEVAGEPVLVARGTDGVLRAFYNVCRHHATAVAWKAAGESANFRCPYHGWTYGLDGALKGMTEFEGVCNFDPARNGLVPIRVETWEQFVFVNLDPTAEPLADSLGGLVARVKPLRLESLSFVERRVYTLKCNWKVYVDNYLDGGYHVPHMHKGLNSVLEYTHYTIENDGRCSIQSSPVKISEDSDASARATRGGDRAYYFWQYPNFMLNWYEGYLDTNFVLPGSPGGASGETGLAERDGVDGCTVIFDFYFGDTSEARREYIQQSIGVSDRVQQEDTAICESVQRGLKSRAYGAGRLSVRREAGEHLFHRLLAADLRQALPPA